MVNKQRSAIVAMVLAASTLVGIASQEGYKEAAYIPVPGDVPTIGFGSTKGVHMGDKTTPVRSLVRLMDEVEGVYVDGLKKCITAPLYQYEFGAYVSLAYNIGVARFCTKADKERLDAHGNPNPEPDRLIDLINAGQYEAACQRIEAFNKAGGKVIKGLTNRRKAEREMCEGINGGSK